jgi:hypothetical protein
MPEPTLVKSLDLLARIQRCHIGAQRLSKTDAAPVNDAVDSLLSAFVAFNGLRNPFMTLPRELREHYRCVSLNFRFTMTHDEHTNCMI